MRRPLRLTAALALTCLCVGCPGPSEESAQDSAPQEVSEEAVVSAKAAAREADTEAALAALERLSDFLAGQQRFSFKAELSYDVVQPTGLMLEFGGTRSVVVRRPDGMRILARDREGDEALLVFDGEQISVSFPGENAYVSVEKPGTLNEAIDYLERDLGQPAPLADFVYADFYAVVAPAIEYALVVGEAVVDEQRTEHLTFSGEEVDFQLWVESGERPLPRRVVVTYKWAPGSPQFRARLFDWDLSPETPDASFAFQPPAGAEHLPFAALGDLAETVQGDQ